MLYTKEESTRFAGASIYLSGRHANNSHGAKQRSLFETWNLYSQIARLTLGAFDRLPHVFAVFGGVCGGNTTENFISKHVSFYFQK